MPRYTDAQIRDVLLATKGMVYVASERLGCSLNTIKARVRQSPALQALLEQESGKVDDLAELKLFQAIQAGDPWAIQFRLKTRAKHRGYVEREEHVVAQLPADQEDPVSAAERVGRKLDELAERRAGRLEHRNGHVVDGGGA
jgi:hypothetical protein